MSGIIKQDSIRNPAFGNRNFNLTPEIILWRSVIVRTMLDALDIDIHAWGIGRLDIIKQGNLWFDTNNNDFNLVCDYANLQSYFVIKIYKKIVEKNGKKLFHGKNLNKLLLEYLCTFTEEH